MTLYPNCKINLGLSIVSKRSDGYHNIETIFYPIPLHDELQIEPAAEDCLSLSGIRVDGNPNDNLVMKVVRLLREKGLNVPPVSINLKKNIPSGAGLGGGSSDAAFTMKALNELFDLGLQEAQMEHWLSPLGADCAVFVRNKPVFAEGIGNIFTPIKLSLKGWYLILIKPDDFIPTREAYAAVHPQAAQYSLLQLAQQPVKAWRGKMKNDFEESVFPKHPTIESIRDALYHLGASYASMSGSGSSVYGLFEKKPLVDDIFEDHFLFECQL